MQIEFEDTILAGLLNNETYCRKVIPFLKNEYFLSSEHQQIFTIINDFLSRYNKVPTKQVLTIELRNMKMSELKINKCLEIVFSIKEETISSDWLYEKTEKFCKDRSIYNALIKSIQIADGENKENTVDAIPSILQEALSVCFDTSIGHDYFEDAHLRHDFYNSQEERITFGLNVLNKVTKGGFFRKTLACFASKTGGGKSMMGVHLTADYLRSGYKVLYITMEMAEMRIAQRVDANMLNLKMDETETIEKERFNNRLAELQKRSSGKLIIKEYPTGSAHAGHFDSLLQELKIKKNFIPDVVVFDYLGICQSQRVKNTAANSYSVLKSVSEELRSLAIKYDFAGVTFMQLNRGGISNNDVTEADTADSFGVVHTFDFYAALIRSEELDEMGQIMCKILKTRYNDPNFFRRFILGVDLAKMKFYDPEDAANDDLVFTKMENDRRIEKAKKLGQNAMDEIEKRFDNEIEDIPLFDKVKVVAKAGSGFGGFDFD